TTIDVATISFTEIGVLTSYEHNGNHDRATAIANKVSSGVAHASPSIMRSARAIASIVDTRPGPGDARMRAAGIGASGSFSTGSPRSAPSLRYIRRAWDHVASSTTSCAGSGTGSLAGPS